MVDMNPSQSDDPVWQMLREEIRCMAEAEPMLASYLHGTVLNHRTFEDALSFLLAAKLDSPHLSSMTIREVIDRAFRESASLGGTIRRDLSAVMERDPAARGLAEPFLHAKGFHALQAYRVSHWLWQEERHCLAFYFKNRIAEVFSVDIHPAARIGQGILIDHATGVVIGETAVVGDDVSMLHAVTLGGTGKETGDRHPKVGSGVLIGAGAKILGNVRIGNGSKIGAGSVVLCDVPPHTTVAGVPAKVVGRPRTDEPSLLMDQNVEQEACVDGSNGSGIRTGGL
jgi:serine O-acetyltransferase